MHNNDNHTLSMMETYGGGFVRALAAAARRADDNNLRRIRAAFPEYWERYSAMCAPQPLADKPTDEAMADRCRSNPNDRDAATDVYLHLK